mgnify:CR=1 FL=1
MAFVCLFLAFLGFLLGWFLHKRYNPQHPSCPDDTVSRAVKIIGDATKVVEKAVCQQTVKLLCGHDDPQMKKLNKALCTFNLQQASETALIPTYVCPFSIDVFALSGGTTIRSGTPRCDTIKPIPVAKFHLKSNFVHVGLPSFEDLDHMKISVVKYVFKHHGSCDPVLSLTRSRSGPKTGTLHNYISDTHQGKTTKKVVPKDTITVGHNQYPVIEVDDSDLIINLDSLIALDKFLEFAIELWSQLEVQRPHKTVKATHEITASKVATMADEQE